MNIYARHLANVARDLLTKWHEDELILEDEYPTKDGISRINAEVDRLTTRIDYLEGKVNEQLQINYR